MKKKYYEDLPRGPGHCQSFRLSSYGRYLNKITDSFSLKCQSSSLYHSSKGFTVHGKLVSGSFSLRYSPAEHEMTTPLSL